MLLMCDWNDSVLSMMTPRLLTWGDGETVESSMVIERLGVLERVDLEPMRRTSVLSLFNLSKLWVNQVFISEMQSVREVGGREEEGSVVR